MRRPRTSRTPEGPATGTPFRLPIHRDSGYRPRGVRATPRTEPGSARSWTSTPGTLVREPPGRPSHGESRAAGHYLRPALPPRAEPRPPRCEAAQPGMGAPFRAGRGRPVPPVVHVVGHAAAGRPRHALRPGSGPGPVYGRDGVLLRLRRPVRRPLGSGSRPCRGRLPGLDRHHPQSTGRTGRGRLLPRVLRHLDPMPPWRPPRLGGPLRARMGVLLRHPGPRVHRTDPRHTGGPGDLPSGPARHRRHRRPPLPRRARRRPRRSRGRVPQSAVAPHAGHRGRRQHDVQRRVLTGEGGGARRRRQPRPRDRARRRRHPRGGPCRGPGGGRPPHAALRGTRGGGPGRVRAARADGTGDGRRPGVRRWHGLVDERIPRLADPDPPLYRRTRRPSRHGPRLLRRDPPPRSRVSTGHPACAAERFADS